MIPNGVHPSFSDQSNPVSTLEVERLLGPVEAKGIELLHVGSTIPRKRIDVLLKVFAKVRESYPNARLIRVGGELTAEQAALAKNLGVTETIFSLPRLEVETVAAVYRRADLVLLPSEREGFGLPVVESLACGTPVVSSELPVLREVGAEVVTYAPVGDIEAWAAAVNGLLRERELGSSSWSWRKEAGQAQASRFTWQEYVRKTVALYLEVASSCS